MANLLSPWLQDLTEKELEQVVLWKQSESGIHTEDGPKRFAKCYKDEGSVLSIRPYRVQLRKCIVQVAEFKSFEGDIEAEVSDGKYSCRAIFAGDCVTTFNKLYARPLTQLRGCLFKIVDCGFKAAFFGGLHTRITLFIDSIQWITGRVGEPTYGSPTPITQNERVLDLLEVLKPNLNAKLSPQHSLEGQVAQSTSSTISRSPALHQNSQSNPRSSRQVPAQRSPLPRSSGAKQAFRGDPVYTEEPGVQQGIRENSSGEEAAPPRGNSAKRITALAMNVASESGELPRKTPSMSSRSGHSQPNIKSSTDPGSADPWAGVEIKRSLTIVPKDQLALLDREESWYPPEPGRRFPIANIPLGVLQELNTAAEENARRQRKSGPVHDNDLNDQHEVGEISDNKSAGDTSAESSSEPEELEEDPDKPFSSDQWPESPARNGVDSLPSDSSDHNASEDSPDRSKKFPLSQEEQPTLHDEHRTMSRRRSLSDDSLIEYSPPQAAKEAPPRGAHNDLRSPKERDQPSAGSSKHKSVAFRTKRAADSPSHGVYLKRMKRMEKTRRKSSSPEPSPRPTDYNLERSKFFADFAKCKSENKTASSPTDVNTSVQVPSTPTPKTLSTRPDNTARSTLGVEQGIRGGTSLEPILLEKRRASEAKSSFHSSRPIDTHHVQTDREGLHIKHERSAQPSQQQTRANSEVDRPPPNVDVFEKFTRAYAEYPGDRKHFWNFCQRLNKLQADGKAQHRFLWDDYIIRHLTEYPSYYTRVNTEGEDPMSYDEYYRHEIEEPLATQRIIDPANLKMAIEQGPVLPSRQHTPASGTTVRAEVQASTSRSLPPITPTPASQKARSERSSGGNEGQRRDGKVVHSPRYDGASAQRQNYHPNINFMDLIVAEARAELTVEDPTEAKPDTRTEVQENGVIETDGVATEEPMGQNLTEAHMETSSEIHAEDGVIEVDGGGDEFTKDYNTPFKEYARAYVSLKSIDGRLGTIHGSTGIVQPPLKRIDTLSWRL
ncbi:MAG: hypothetical protein Q9165_001853 [Trypethelium subeluteriae]